jgi:hypothetical protein
MLYKSRKLSLCATEPPSDWAWSALDESAAAALCITAEGIRSASLGGAWQCLTFRA